MASATLLVLGESPPPKAPPDFIPFDCQSGTNLARFLGLKSRAEVVAHLPRANCFDTPTGVGEGTPAWDEAQAAVNVADRLCASRPRVVVALGRRPANALGIPENAPPLTWRRFADVDTLHVPHPSGRSAALNTEPKRREARQAMLVEVVLGCPTLRPWHFRLDEPEVLADLGAALCPLRPALGVAACILAEEIWAHHERVKSPAFATPKALAVADEAARQLLRIDIPLAEVAALAARDLGALTEALSVNNRRRGLQTQERNAQTTMPEVQNYPPAVLRAIYGRHVALGVAP